MKIVEEATSSLPRESILSVNTLRFVLGLLRRLTGNRLHLLVVLATLIAFVGSYWGAYLLRFEFAIPPVYGRFLLHTLPFILIIKLCVFYVNGIYRILWAYIGLKDLHRILFSAAFASGIISVTNWLLFPFQLVPRSVLVLDGVLCFVSVSGVYAVLRSLREANSGSGASTPVSMEPAFIIGAGDAGETLLRELQRNRNIAAIRIVGFLDDDPHKWGSSLRGVKVLGEVASAEQLGRDLGVRKAFIAIPSAGGAEIRGVVEKLLAGRISMKILPPVTRLSAQPFAAQLREVSIEDLLRREPIKLDVRAIASSIRNQIVLVTGAAGSIGSELCRQILEQHPSRLVVFDLAESPLHALQLELEDAAKGCEIVVQLGDVTDSRRIKAIIGEQRPTIVFHAAALKHVPMMEMHPSEAVRVNVIGTRNVAEASLECGVGSFILISTDKAVNPASVMGFTKRLAELSVLSLSQVSRSRTRFMIVRFGNVLGSNGSVLPIFKSQLAKGGPLTVTHPEMKRYFMTIPEAVQLVLQASVLGAGGEIFVLDMGQPIYIKDFATDLIRLSGLVPGVDVRIEYSGIRPGEKLFEELHQVSENVTSTSHPRVLRILLDRAVSLDEVFFKELERFSVTFENATMAKSALRGLVTQAEQMISGRGRTKIAEHE